MFDDRAQAGRLLGERLAGYKGKGDLLVLGLPRGGIPVAFEVARALEAPLDVFVVRKLPSPISPELAIGAIASGGVRVVNEDTVASLAVSQAELDAVAEAESRELARREKLYREGRPPLELKGRSVILVDDGLATGASMRAAAKAARKLGARKVVVAVPVGSAETCASLEEDADEVVCAETPEAFFAVGLWYHDFKQTTDEEVRALLARPTRPAPV